MLKRNNGMLLFSTAMVSSLISLTGTQMTIFAVVAWAWQATHSAAESGLVTIASFATIVITSVFTGALVDRWNRKLAIICTDVAGAVASACILLLHIFGLLQIWHLLLLGIILGLLESFQFSAYLSSITELIGEEQRGRANGMFQLSWSISGIVSSVLAGFLFAVIGLNGILIVDIVSFAFIIVTIALLPLPRHAREGAEQTTLWQDLLEGFTYLFQRPILYWTVLMFGAVNIAYGAYLGLFKPMVLALTSNNVVLLGQVLGAYAVGSIVGGFIMTLWKGPKKKTPVMLLGWSLMSLSGFVLTGLGRSLIVWAAASFLQGFFNDVALALMFALWQSQIKPEMQGRIFGVIRLVSQGSIPLATLLATLLADHLFIPAMQPGLQLAQIFDGVVGTGTGAGISLDLVFIGLFFGVLAPLACFLIPAVRDGDLNGGVLPAVMQEESLRGDIVK